MHDFVRNILTDSIRALQFGKKVLGAAASYLDPNGNLEEHVRRYTFSLDEKVTLGKEKSLFMKNGPLAPMTPEKILFNVPCFNFALIATIQCGNMSIVIGGYEDAGNYTPDKPAGRYKCKHIGTADQVVVMGVYTGLSPAPFTEGNEYMIVATFQGPARLSFSDLLFGEGA